MPHPRWCRTTKTMKTRQRRRRRRRKRPRRRRRRRGPRGRKRPRRRHQRRRSPDLQSQMNPPAHLVRAHRDEPHRLRNPGTAMCTGGWAGPGTLHATSRSPQKNAKAPAEAAGAHGVRTGASTQHVERGAFAASDNHPHVLSPWPSLSRWPSPRPWLPWPLPLHVLEFSPSRP